MDTTASPPTRTPEQRQRAIDRAMSKALEQARAGNLPTLLRIFTSPDGLETRQFWTVSSRTVAGSVYNVDLTADSGGIKTLCTCAAAEADRLCWHRAAVRLAASQAIEYHDGRQAVPETDQWITEPDGTEDVMARPPAPRWPSLPGSTASLV